MMWLSAPELAGLPGMPTTARAVLMRAETGTWTTRPRAGRGRAGQEYLVTDLPPETQQALAARAAGSVRPLTQAVQAGQAAAQAQQVQACAASMAKWGQHLERTGGLDPERNPRLDLFQRFETYHRTRAGAVWPCIVEFCALWDARQIEALPTTLTAYPALPPKTLDKWYRSWRVNGVEALLERKPRRDKGKSQLAQDEELYGAFVSAIAGMHEPTARQVARQIEVALGADRVPAMRTLERWIQEFKSNNKVALLKLKNPDGWRNKYMPAFGSRSEHLTAPNQEWQQDSTIADAQQRVQHELAFNLVDQDTGEVRRHALVATLDVFTRRAAVLVSRTSSSNAVKAITRRAMLAWGIPQVIKTDNGKDYTAVDYEFALDALKIEHKLCTPFSPDQKPFIERFLGTLLHDLFPMLAGFVGHDVATRKAIESAKSFAQRFGDKGVDLRMSPEQLQGVIDGWLVEYHDRVHSELGCTPNQMAERHTTSVVRIDERALDLFMMPVAGNGVRTVGKRGISMPLNDRAGTAWYRAPELASVDVMGREVYCRIAEDDIGAMYVFHLDGTFICRAQDHSRLGLNRAELAAKARAIESATVKPIMDRMRREARRGLTQKAVDTLYAERQDAAVEASTNVTRLQPRVVVETPPAVQSVLAAQGDRHAEARQAARQAMAQDDAPAAPVLRMDTARHRYSAFVRLRARMAEGQQISTRDAEWLRSYEDSSEFQAWDSMQQGIDPLAAAG